MNVIFEARLKGRKPVYQLVSDSLIREATRIAKEYCTPRNPSWRIFGQQLATLCYVKGWKEVRKISYSSDSVSSSVIVSIA